MKNNKFTFLTVALVFSIVFSCCFFPQEKKNPETITVMSWNVQNLFDDVYDGAEFQEYNPEKSQWNTAGYKAKLENLARVIRAINPDVVLLQETEHLKAVMDLARKTGTNAYPYVTCSSTRHKAHELAIISRIPVSKVRTISIPPHDEVWLRPVLKAELNTGHGTIIVYNNHWKSKYGGGKATEPLRISAAQILKQEISKARKEHPDAIIIAGGDFNESPDEYYLNEQSFETAFMPFHYTKADGRGIPLISCSSAAQLDAGIVSPVMVNPWNMAEQNGSYYYRGSWEKIDSILCSPSLFDAKGYDAAGFKAVMLPFSTTEKGRPMRFFTSSYTGYSDHFPILLSITYVSEVK